ncbi:protein LONG AFTER FAR-RED 3 [Cannabis sativa]|uniref:protein LONG AFTER FAR-RED 3 n=1 Tax=Cannabis sativa TaxID=3483 RepID=UPI0029C9E6EC|nr:protein LONG AFTER FAR-RED 3 [Cannabis sativa]XP_060964436.1 protein LONG AFTER FAR-RED 3 [Cannabis sativa]
MKNPYYSFIWVSASLAILLLALSLSYFSKSQWTSSPMPITADFILTNALIFTSDDTIPFADSMAIRRGTLLRVGNYSSLKAVVGSGTKELNLNGKIVVPGFIDSHVHLISGGLQLMQLQFRGVNKKDEFVRRIAESVQNRKPGSWILGGGWNNDLWGGDLPTASWIDDITPNNPVWLPRTDGHMGLANSVALKLAGINNSSKDPDGGTIMRTASGVPTGLLIDSAMKLVVSYVPELSIDQRREALQRASSLALMKGVTTVVDFGRYFPGTSVDRPWEDLSDVYQWADSSGKMRIRVCLFFPLETWSRLRDVVNKVGHSISKWIYLGGVKAFADGSLGSNSAMFYEPYVEEPQNYGLPVADYEKLFNMTLAADNHMLQVAIHAIGDRTNDMILDMYASVISKNGIRDRRFRIEHAQHLAPGTADRFGELGIIASVQPDHLLDDFESATKKLGFDRAQKGSYLFGSLLSGNATLAFGSDWPVANINPLGGVRTAMTRKSPAWENAWNPYESISVHDALKAHTISAARACFLDKDIGSLSPGKLADFVVLSTDSWDEFASVGSASVEATYVAGIQVYPS